MATLSKITKSAIHEEAQAFEYLEKTLWPDGPVCPHCGSLGTATRLEGKASRLGVWQCNEKECRKQFSIKGASQASSAERSATADYESLD